MENNFNIIQQNISNGIYPYLGSGSGRRVFDMNNGYVIKAAKNRKGYAQNRTEDDIFHRDSSKLFAKIIDVSEDYHFLLMQKADRINNYHYLCDYFHVDNMSQLLNLPALQYVIHHYHLVSADISRLSSWGLIYGVPYIIDYGFTREVRSKYYRP